MGDELDRFSKVISPAFFLDDVFKDLARAQAIDLRKGRFGKALVVAQIEICFCAIIEDVDLAVLVRGHRAWIDVEIGVELLEKDFQAAVLKESSDGGCGESFSKAGDNASGDKNVFHVGQLDRRDSIKGTWSGESRPGA